MAWLRAADTEVKRDMEISRDEVRVMTVHGAKGLEASVVFLADTVTSPADTERLSLIRLPRGNAPAHAAGVTVWAGRKAEDPPAVATARATMTGETENEYRRLLYVAMTRAADRLIVGGCMPRKAMRDLSWYDLIAKGLSNSGLAEQVIETTAGTVRRYTRPGEPEPETSSVSHSGVTAETAGLPGWLRAAAPERGPPERQLRPSDSADDGIRRVPAGESRELRARAVQRGTLVHRLLQSLPDISPERREDAATRYLARNAADWTGDERGALATQVLALMSDARFAPVFAPGSRAEVAIVGRVTAADGRPVPVSGQIDRLVVTPDHILIVDYKTNHNPPRLAADAPPPYVGQLALYRALLAKLYDRPVRAALLWTETPEMMEISASALDAGLAAIISV
jgi:ATP-dependent helicase/nuclease subunit A